MSKQQISAVTGLAFAFEVLIDRLAKDGALDRNQYISDLKLAYNSLDPSHADSAGGVALHTLIRHLEHGPKRRKKS
jgi:hypothetical protein